MQSKKFKIISFIVFVIAIIMLTVIVVPLLRRCNNPAEFKAYIDSLESSGFFMMMFIQLAQIVVALIPGEVVEFVAGTLYGWLGGLLFCLAGIAIGQTVIFLIVRYLGKDFAQKLAGSDTFNRFKFLQDESKLKTVVFFLFFIPGTPKDLLTYVVPLTKISLKSFLLISIVARIPSVISSTFAGDAFSEQNYLVLIIAYSVILIFSGIGVLVYRLWSKKREQRKQITNPAK